MNEFHIGDVIRIRRTELGLSQEELAEGICETSTLSRIENGDRTPSKSKLNALLQKLDLPSEKYFALVSQNDLEIENLRSEIVFYNYQQDYNGSLEKLNQLEKIVEKDDHITQQFILRSKVIIGKEENGVLHPYTYEESLDLLIQAVHLTIKRFDLNAIDHHLYTVEELKIINHIAIIFNKLGDTNKTLDIYHQLMRYMKKYSHNMSDFVRIKTMIAYNFSNILCQKKLPEEALEVAEFGRQQCIVYGHLRHLPGLLVVTADCLHQLGRDEESKEYFLQSYYGYKAIEDTENAKIVKGHAYELLNLDI